MGDLRTIADIVIVGGGTAGWMAANVLCERMRNPRITLVESPDISRIGVGEALTPFFYLFLNILRYDPIQFITSVGGSIKLAVRFENWCGTDDVYYHPFQDGGDYFSKPEFAVSPGYNRLVSYAVARDIPLHDLATSYAVLSHHNKVPWYLDFKQNKDHYHGFGAYAYHMDTTKFADTFGDRARRRGVRHIQANVVSVNRNSETGFIESLSLQDGRTLRGDLFVDCTGFQRRLISLFKPRWQSYAKWLPVDAAIPFSIPHRASNGPIPPYTLARALDAGWLWRIPLMDRHSAGYVYSQEFATEEEATRELDRTLGGKVDLAERPKLKFDSGALQQTWIKNCVAVGLSAGFIEPLESTSIQIALTQILGIVDVLRDRFSFDPKLLDRYNKAIQLETEDIRDFIILHYATCRDDTAFWKYIKRNKDNLDYPDTLRDRLAMAKYRTMGHNRIQSQMIRGRVFGELSGLYVLQGLNLLRKENSQADFLLEYPTLARAISDVSVPVKRLQNAIREFNRDCIGHADFLRQL